MLASTTEPAATSSFNISRYFPAIVRVQDQEPVAVAAAVRACSRQPAFTIDRHSDEHEGMVRVACSNRR